MPIRKKEASRILAGLSYLIAIVGALGMFRLSLQPSSGSVQDSAAMLGWGIAANSLCLLLNILYWRLRRGPPWLFVTICLQIVLFIGLAIWWAYQVIHDRRYMAADKQQRAITLAIQQDDVEQWMRARNACKDDCKGMFNTADANIQLLIAADYGARRIAEQLLKESVTISGTVNLQSPARSTLSLCEGGAVSVSALGAAVAHHNLPMMRMLFPISDQRARQQALEIAAQLDYIDIVQELASQGVKLYDTLLVQAARGGAWRVGTMLLQSLPADTVNPVSDPLWQNTLLEALLDFHYDTGSPQATPFLQMLIAHGVAIDAIEKYGETLLQSAIRQEKKRSAQWLIESGADTSHLTQEQEQALQQLLSQETDPSRSDDTYPKRCINHRHK